MTNKHQAVWDWMYQCPAISDLYFNSGVARNGDTILATSAAEKAKKVYVGGSSLRQYDFTVVQFKTVNADVPNNPENVQVMVDVEQVMNWILAQNEQRNFPAFPENCTIQRIETLANMPTVAGQDATGAKFMFSARIVYLQQGV